MISIYDHPITSTNYYVKTPRFEDLHSTLVSWIYTGIIGAYIWGLPRNGKSSFIMNSMGTYETRSHEVIPCFCFISKTTSIPTDKKFYGAILESIKHKNLNGNEQDRRIRAVNFIEELASSNSEKRIIFFIDEAQKLKPLHFNLFSDIYNELKMRGINSHYFFFGSLNSSELIKNYSGDNHEHLKARFFRKYYIFRGITTLEELKDILELIDNSEIFSPSIATNLHKENIGIKIHDHSKIIWEAFKETVANQPRKEWPMEYFIHSISTLFSSALTDYSFDYLKLEHIKRIIETSYEESI